MSDLSEVNLIQVLEQASDPKNIGSDVQKLAEAKLKEWEIQEGFHYYLQSIYLNVENSLQIRWLSIIQFKNGVEKYWRSTRSNAINKNEKLKIRDRLFNLINEKNNQLSIQNAQAASKIARFDFPVQWVNLFETLEQLLEMNAHDEIKTYNILLHLNQIIKTLGAARIGRCKPAMQSKIPLILKSVVRIYLENFNNWTSSSIKNNEKFTLHLQISYVALKSIRRMINDGVENPAKDETVCDFMKLSIQHFEILISNYNDFKKFDNYEKFIKCYGKLYYNLITNSPATFILLPCSIDILIVYTKIIFEYALNVYNEVSDTTGDFWEQTVIRGLLIFKRVINFIFKKGAITLKARSDKASIDLAIAKINSDFLNEQLIKNLIDTLMTWYLKLRPSELESWCMDQEEWINEQMSTSFEYQIRPCAENIFQDLINTFPEFLVPYLLNKIENDASKLSNSLEDFLMKDSIYSTFQLSANAICDMVDFDRLLVDIFLTEALDSTNNSTDQLKIIRRRVALIINEWSVVKCSENSKRICYEFFGNILMNENDKVVLLTVVQSLRTMVDDWNFNKETFQPYLKDIVTLLLRKILPSVSLTETRLYVLNTLSDIIIQTKPLISKELLVEVLQIIPELWEISTNSPSEGILSSALIRLLRNLVQSLGAQSLLTWEIALPVVSMACDPASQHYHLLNEDGFELWGMLLQHYSTHDSELDDRFLDFLPFLEDAIEKHTEILPTLLEIVKSYALILTPQQFFMSDSFMKVFTYLSSYLLKLRDDSFYLILEIWEILILSNESDFENILLQKFFDMGILNSLFNSIFKQEALSNHQCGQLLQIIARISYVNPSALMKFIELYHQSLPTTAANAQMDIEDKKVVFSDMPFDRLFSKLISSWEYCFNDIFDPKLKKIHILGISSLLRTGLVVVLSEITTIMQIWVDLLEEINETNGGDCEKYHLNDIVTEQTVEFYQLTTEQLRHHELFKTHDPVHNISLREFIKQTLEYLESHLGPQRYQEFFNNVNQSLRESLLVFLSIQQPTTN